MLYELDLKKPQSSKRVSIQQPDVIGVEEKHIEEFLAGHLLEIIPEDRLLLIGQERRGKEEADLFALDKDGTLYIFELKRWKSNTENLLQVLRYGQIFGRKNYEELQALARKHEKLTGELKKSHQEHFQLSEPLVEEAFNQEQVFVLVTNGIDHDTLDAINYWKQKGLRIDSITYKLYSVEGKLHIYFDVYDPMNERLGEQEPGIYIVNTNATYMADAWKDMLETPKASAYYTRKSAVSGIAKGSTVYLYHTGVGVIAKGKAKDTVQKKAHDGNPEEEYYIPLVLDWKLSEKISWAQQAIPAWAINQKLETGHRFRNTAFVITKEMADVIDQFHEQGLNVK